MVSAGLWNSAANGASGSAASSSAAVGMVVLSYADTGRPAAIQQPWNADDADLHGSDKIRFGLIRVDPWQSASSAFHGCSKASIMLRLAPLLLVPLAARGQDKAQSPDQLITVQIGRAHV